jgi:hypothetical protein
MNKRLIFLLVLVGLLVILSVSVVAAQSVVPTVTIKATDPIAKEPSDNGEFTVYRSNSSGSVAPLTVYYSVTGTATNGVDYAKLTGSVVIPGGAASALIPVKVIDDKLKEPAETVIVTIIPYCPGPLPCTYNNGTPATATVTIYDND